ncbi:hypothetical protein CPB84DRAFT_1844963 [Gymnopilus junonius]|uniref:Uncharacterized protein n=1 Tax=Gymnopilus junonius TaxID=109634 RepID=A0A9P5NUE5_GYMJU|nr:hypothetical protein CPB84DRAFT_1844963 [Gymnopilus junonius]
MILEYDKDDKKRLAATRLGSADDSAGPSSRSPARLSTDADPDATENDHLLVDMVPSEPPPVFVPYEAEYFKVGYDDIVSHDPHLNSDGEALYRFILAQSATPPTYRLHCHGTHSETRTRWVTQRDSQGRSRTRQETYNETVTDFDFCMDITPGAVDAGYLASNSIASSSSSSRTLTNQIAPIHWSVPDDEPAYRGKMVREYEIEPSTSSAAGPGVQLRDERGRRPATRKESKAYERWIEKRAGLGFPPWIREVDVEHRVVVDPAGVSALDNVALKSSKTLRQWADEYCDSPKYLKEFVYEKVAYGWNMQQIESAVRATIQATPYNGNLNITFVPHNTKIYIRPDNRVSRMLSNKWLKFLSILFFIFPFVWLFKRFHSKGGGKWEVCGGAYPLKQWVPLGQEEVAAAALEAENAANDAGPSGQPPGDVLPPYNEDLSLGFTSPTTPTTSSGSRWFTQTPAGPKKLIGVKEGEWFKSWEGTITRAVAGRYQSTEPLARSGHSNIHARSLDGYEDGPASRLVEF